MLINLFMSCALCVAVLGIPAECKRDSKSRADEMSEA